MKTKKPLLCFLAAFAVALTLYGFTYRNLTAQEEPLVFAVQQLVAVPTGNQLAFNEVISDNRRFPRELPSVLLLAFQQSTLQLIPFDQLALLHEFDETLDV